MSARQICVYMGFKTNRGKPVKDDKGRLIKEYNYIPPELARIVPGQKAVGISEVGAARDDGTREEREGGQKSNSTCARATAAAAAAAADDDTGTRASSPSAWSRRSAPAVQSHATTTSSG